MRQRLIKLIITAVTISVLFLGIPSTILGGILVWRSEQLALDNYTATISNTIDRRLVANEPVTASYVRSWAKNDHLNFAVEHLQVRVPGNQVISVGEDVQGISLRSVNVGASGTVVVAKASGWKSVIRVATYVLFLSFAILLSLLVGVWLALRGSRKLSAPLIYLAAQAEQIGAGQVRASVQACGIEEIDLVQEELVRAGERMAGRLVAERQFAANASHQLRTPLTALSMRLEEIELVATDPTVQDEARICLEQVERLTQVIQDLLNTSSGQGVNPEAFHILEVFNQQREEWEESFAKRNRTLRFVDEAAQPVLADRSILTQILATLIENSLQHGAGTTTVSCRKGASSRSVTIVVIDEGAGIPSDLVNRIFEKGVSGQGSSGFGLALAKDLATAIGARLELTGRKPAEFTISLAAMPAGMQLDSVVPQGAVVAVSRRRRRF
ncbi:HAMP domain-containing histidine kinase [Gleimia sp. 6138-11-ORH1]|uniref:sensor histidine kinase n=1 Tax=Gleimia sp. 6138-11-ORH1 TaxID=2973937 RepID=UPI0021690714|nr:HAMP domain-containing sensor histidine kinase [Gleimia sp. 6138-11-ORH1]MCS4483994.1 HAMP domain-containing histidine kinase [Gleimia sp. 6138-11-ORH1]